MGNDRKLGKAEGFTDGVSFVGSAVGGFGKRNGTIEGSSAGKLELEDKLGDGRALGMPEKDALGEIVGSVLDNASDGNVEGAANGVADGSCVGF